MIVHRQKGFLILFRETLPPLLYLAVWDILVVVLFQIYHQEWMEQPTLPISLMGTALALFLGMRNNAAYARWWEGRTLWGAITNNCRSFGREAATLLGGRPDLVRAMAAYPHILRAALGNYSTGEEVERLLSPEMHEKIFACSNKANATLYYIGMGVAEEVARKGIDGAVHGTVDRILSDLANAQGGLERIRGTPLPVQYSLLPNAVTHIFCIVLPLSAVQTLGWITPLGSSAIGLLFQALDRSGKNLQEPFQTGPHALPMATMARNIERDLLQPIGDEAPPPITPENGIAP